MRAMPMLAWLILLGSGALLRGQMPGNGTPNCSGSAPTNERIIWCTVAIESGKDTKSALSKDYMHRAEAYAESGDVDSAIADMKQALPGCDPSDCLTDRGTMYLQKGDYSAAIADFDKVRELMPNSWRPYAMLGLAHLFGGQFAVAEADLTRALAADPSNARIGLMLYVAQSRSGKDGRGLLVKNSEKFTGLSGLSWPSVLVLLIEVGETPAEVLKAAANPNEATTRDNDRVAYYYLGQEAMVAGHLDEARKLFQQVIALGRPPFQNDSSVEFMAAEAELRGKPTVPPIQIAEAEPDNRGMNRPVTPAAAAFPNGNYYALVIGINRYPAPVPPLKTAVHDAEAIAKDLQDLYGFQVTLLRDGEATRARIITAIRGYRNALGPNDSLLIYYAGHGFSDKEADKAYWLPVDADSVESPNAIIADDLTTDVRVQNARHVLIISDSCYSGGLTRDVDTRPPTVERQAYVLKMLSGKSRTLMASGGDEPVSDKGAEGHSVFADAVLQALEHSDQTMFTASDLFYHSVLQRVAGNSAQTPEYEFIKNSGHDNGDFVFVRK